jgi:FMN phosphatase YigB (HAD superfamily)
LTFSEDQFWQEVRAAAELNEPVAELKTLLRDTQMRVFWRSMAVAERLRDRGCLLAILSNHAKPWFDELAWRFRFSDLFDPQLTIVSYQVGAAKPDDRAFQILLERVGNGNGRIGPEQCIFVDNQLRNVQAAATHQLQAIRFDATRDPVSKLVASLIEHGIDAEEH